MASVTVIFGGQEQKTFPLDKPELVVGREPTCDIPIDNLGISRQHCAFKARGDAFVVADMNSSNGTFVNGKKITEHYLNNDDEVVIGKYTLKFKNANQAASPAAPAEGSAGGVPDTLNTYVMDGAKIQEQLAKMRGGAPGASGAAPATGAPPAAAPGATAKDYAKALDPGTPAPAGEVSALKTYLAALVVVVVVLLVVVGVLFYKSTIKP